VENDPVTKMTELTTTLFGLRIEPDNALADLQAPSRTPLKVVTEDRRGHIHAALVGEVTDRTPLGFLASELRQERRREGELAGLTLGRVGGKSIKVHRSFHTAMLERSPERVLELNWV
jgi:hypothetical protein